MTPPPRDPPSGRGCLLRLAAVALTVAAILATPSPPAAAQSQWPQARLTGVHPPSATRGSSVVVTLTGSDLEGVDSLRFSHPGFQVEKTADLTFKITVGTDVPLGRHDLRAVGTYGVTNPRVFTVGARPELVEREPNDTVELATPVPMNAVALGTIGQPTDLDHYVFEATKKRRVTLTLEADRIDSPLDASLRLFGPDGQPLAEVHDTIGPDPVLHVVPPHDGLYIVQVRDVTFAGSPDHYYRLVLHDGPVIDAALPASARPGETVELTLFGLGLGEGSRPLNDPNPADFHSPPLEARSLKLILPPETARDATQLAIPTLTAVGDRSGFLVDLDGETTAPKPATPGHPLVRTRPHDPLFLALADPELLPIAEVEPNDGGPKASDPVQTATLPLDLSGAFQTPGDRDVIRFNARKDQVWWIECQAERIDSPALPSWVLQRIDPAQPDQPARDLAVPPDSLDLGAGARWPSATVDTTLRWVVPEDGVYQIVLTDQMGSTRGDPRLRWRLVIRPETGRHEFAAFVAPASPTIHDAVTIPAGGKEIAYVHVQRRMGFAGAVRIEAVELPAGVTCRPVVAGPTQSLVPLVFEAAADAPRAVGPIRLNASSRWPNDETTHPGRLAAGEGVTRRVIPGGLIRPTPNPPFGAARVSREFPAAVRDPKPAVVSARPRRPGGGPEDGPPLAIAVGSILPYRLETRRAEGIAAPIVVASESFAPNLPAANVTVPPDQTQGVLAQPIPSNVTPGLYSFAFNATLTIPFSKDPNAAQKPNINVIVPTETLELDLRPAVVTLALEPAGALELKRGGTLQIKANLTRQNNFAGPVTVEPMPDATADPAAVAQTLTGSVVIPGDASQGVLTLSAATEAPEGPLPGLALRAVAEVDGVKVAFVLPVDLKIVP